MSDPGWELLEKSLANHQGSALWLVDETIQQTALRRVAAMQHAQLEAITNRFDIHLALDQLSINNSFSDFAFNNEGYPAIFLRLTKEKALNHYLINKSFQHLQHNGLFYVAGKKNEGIKSILPKITTLFSGCVEKLKGPKQSQLAVFRKSSANPNCDWLDDNDYETLRPITTNEPPLYSKPGQFGWNKIDRGSELLIDYLPEFINGFKQAPTSLLDLGCGYGFLVCHALHLPLERIVATDNNAAAIASVKKNLAVRGLALDGKTAVIADDCAQSITEKFHCILCNPPFHQGFNVAQDLTDTFLHAARRLLRNNGQALFVVNQFIPLERKAETLFTDVRQVISDGGFKLITLAKPKRHR